MGCLFLILPKMMTKNVEGFGEIMYTLNVVNVYFSENLSNERPTT